MHVQNKAYFRKAVKPRFYFCYNNRLHFIAAMIYFRAGEYYCEGKERRNDRLEICPESLETAFNRLMQVSIERKDRSSKWVAFNALRVLKGFLRA